jgi:hypothetical protein
MKTKAIIKFNKFRKTYEIYPLGIEFGELKRARAFRDGFNFAIELFGIDKEWKETNGVFTKKIQ